jgi:hypothetical protein
MRELYAPAALLLNRQVVAGQEGGESLPLGGGVDERPDEMARRERDTPVPQQRSEAPPVQSAARLPAHSDGGHRIPVMRILRDLIRDRGPCSPGGGSCSTP